MTRVNTVPVTYLTDQHLMAEYREIKMVPAALRRSLRTKPVDEILARIPTRYTLGKGHVTFFYDKMYYLIGRYLELIIELKYRGYNIAHTGNFTDFTSEIPAVFFNNQWLPDKSAINLNAQRIIDRITMKPHWYKWYGAEYSLGFYKKLYKNAIR